MNIKTVIAGAGGTAVVTKASAAVPAQGCYAGVSAGPSNFSGAGQNVAIGCDV